MEVRRLADCELSAYDVLASEKGKVFYSRDWRNVFGKALRTFGVFDGQGKLVGGFQVVEERRFGARILRNPPFTPVVGPFMTLNAKHPVARLEEQRRIVEAMASYLASIPWAVVLVSLDHEIDDALAFHWKGFKTVPRYTYVLDLRRSLEEIHRDFSSTRRNDITKARRDGLKVEEVTDMQIVAELVRSTFVRQRAHLDTEVLDSILFRYATAQNSFACATKRDNRTIACTFVVHDRTTAYYLLSGYSSEHKHHGAGALALAECIRMAQQRGLLTFDFEGSSIQAVERFFRGFGGRLTHHLTVSRAWFPFEVALKLKWRNYF